MRVDWELRSENLTLFKLSMETDHFYSASDTFGAKLVLGVNIHPYFGLDSRDLLSIGGEIYWQTDNVNVPSTFLIPEQPLNSGRPIIIPMTREIIQQIEKVRNGGPVSFQIALHGMCYVASDHDHQTNGQVRSLVDSQFQRLVGRPTMLTSDRHTLVQIHREKWAELLKGMNVSSYRLVELPTLKLTNRQTNRWENVLQRYESMLQKKRVGNFEECIEESRRIVDELVALIGGHFNLNMGDPKKSGDFVNSFHNKLDKKLPDDQRDHCKSFANLLFSITNFSSLYHHAGNRPTVFGNLREQAEHVVLLCTAAVSASSRILEWVPPGSDINE
ncbi:hypothetical protein [Heyndrickxia acidicola]|uniref:Uncharacterized protein n=1 Tax=Heyndrickxia acidicola TaxID=209389 RepID=A0ABU6MP71_9BACI|nr:hypothetical protein [Heyndrickxia acidicola]MED1206099.1 hypothetical protein [Heyndrickxia acidicola]